MMSDDHPESGSQVPELSPKKIAIHGVPRSGTSWLGEIVNSSPATAYRYQPLFSYALKDFLGPESSAADIASFFKRLENIEDDFLDQEEHRNKGLLPRFSKGAMTHVCYKEVRYHHILENLLSRAPDVRLIAIIRNPLAVLSSWFASPREFRRDLGWREEDEWRFAPGKNQGRPEEFYGYEKWKEAAKLFHSLYQSRPGQVLLVRYEQLLAAPLDWASRVFEFCDLELGPQTRRFVLESTQSKNVTHPYSVFRSGKSADDRKAPIDPSIEAWIARDLDGDELSAHVELR